MLLNCFTLLEIALKENWNEITDDFVTKSPRLTSIIDSHFEVFILLFLCLCDQNYKDTTIAKAFIIL